MLTLMRRRRKADRDGSPCKRSGPVHWAARRGYERILSANTFVPRTVFECTADLTVYTIARTVPNDMRGSYKTLPAAQDTPARRNSPISCRLPRGYEPMRESWTVKIRQQVEFCEDLESSGELITCTYEKVQPSQPFQDLVANFGRLQ